jgi:hypothetical protein
LKKGYVPVGCRIGAAIDLQAGKCASVNSILAFNAGFARVEGGFEGEGGRKISGKKMGREGSGEIMGAESWAETCG